MLHMNPNAQQPIRGAENPLEVMQPGEQVICVIRRHPIGLFGIYTVAGIILAVMVSAAILLPYYLTFLTDQEKLGLWLGAALIIVLSLVFTHITKQ